MRRNRPLSLVLGVVLVVLGIAWFAVWKYGQHPAGVSVSITGHESSDGMFVISAMVANTGSVPLVYYGSPPEAEVRIKTTRGWTNVPQSYTSKSASFGFVLPGRSLSYHFTVPQEVTRVQVGCWFETAGARAWAEGRLLESGWWNRLYRVWDFVLPILPDGRREIVEFWSPETKIM